MTTPSFYGARDAAAAKIIGRWLWVMAALVALMVVIGGATRLTDSGLSITQWDLLMGTLPPLSDQAWQQAFALYQQIPEYELVNKGMTLTEFKSIYWWEWGHRFLGRFIGLAFLIPALFFLFRGMMTSTGLKTKLFGLFILICAQGVLGWYMVMSGLTERVDVSQYRLAAHLGAAVLLFGGIVWVALKLTIPRAGTGARKEIHLRKFALWFGVALFGQIILGAFVAGLRAGKSYNTWPLMEGRFVPEAYAALSSFETIAGVQFHHRIGAYIVTFLAAALYLQARKAGQPFARYSGFVVMAVIGQVLLGIWTLIAAVPISLGLLHQIGALGVLTCVLLLIHKLEPR